MASPGAKMPMPSPAYLAQNIGYQLTIPIVIWLVASFVCVVLRLNARRMQKVGMGIDDWLVVGAEFFGMALAIDTLLLPGYGVGRHIEYVLMAEPGDLLDIGKVNFALEIAYIPTMTLAKMSVLSLYLRIFSSAPRWFTIITWIMVGYTALWCIGMFLVVFLECHPLSTLWTGLCAPPDRVTYSTNLLNIFADVVIFIIPQPIIWSLHMPTSRRLAVSVILLLGLFASVISIVRIPLIIDDNSPDITWGLVVVETLTVLEPLTVIICACLPVMQVYTKYIFKSGMGLNTLRSIIRGQRSQSSQKPVEPGRPWQGLETRSGDNSSAATRTYDEGSETENANGGIWKTDTIELQHVGTEAPKHTANELPHAA